MTRAQVPRRAILCLAPLPAVSLLVLFAGTSWASDDALTELDLFRLEEEVRQTVTTITKTKQDLREAPSVVTVMTREDIRSRGYRSIAQVLASVAGFHVIDDLVFPDAGVRGVHGGAHAASRLVKVMVDGHPVDFRPTTGYALGPELIPIEVVERIEVIRGPVSALYGADAFLGVVNIITRNAEDVGGFWLGYRAGGMQVPGAFRPRVGGSLLYGAREGRLELVLAASLDTQDRSGLALPSTSPDLHHYSEPTSEDDRAMPGSMYGRLVLDLGHGASFRLFGGFSETFTDQRFVDTAIEEGRNLALTSTRVALSNRYLKGELAFALGATDLLLSVAHGSGEVKPGDRIDVASPAYDRIRRLSYESLDVVGEARYQPRREFSLVGGVDYSREVEEPQRVYTLYKQRAGVFRPGDLRLLSSLPADRLSSNLGLYAQAIYYPIQNVGLTTGVRLDSHSLYGKVPSGRLGVVFLLGDSAHVKALVGTSFKAPSDDQLFSEALYEGALSGNSALAEQRASTGELVFGMETPGKYSASLTGFYTVIQRKVEFLPTGSALKADNVGELSSVGLEAEGKFLLRLRSGWSVDGWGNLSWVVSEKESARAVLTTAAESYPDILSNIGLGATARRWHLRLGGELNHVGSLPASGSNLLIAKRHGKPAYRIGSHALLGLTLSTVGIKYGPNELVLRLSLKNLLNTSTVQPGFGGNDIPGLGRTVLLEMEQQF
ncbi:MAG: TonB-dependent receptor [Deltaproteobacteria bacterium]|nr:TonB-dependent receptor [Deltaproteobacteria bacterium]